MANSSRDTALAQRLEAETHAWLERGRPLCLQAGRRLPDVAVRLDLRGASAGQLRQYRNGDLVIRYNLAMAAAQPEAFIAQTVPHEVAHVITHVCHGRVRPHGAEWRRVMAWFGFDEPTRCHDFAPPGGPSRRQRRWDYRCGCREHQLSTTRHNRAQQGLAYICRACGMPLRYQPGPARSG
jgi:SprT protein